MRHLSKGYINIKVVRDLAEKRDVVHVKMAPTR